MCASESRVTKSPAAPRREGVVNPVDKVVVSTLARSGWSRIATIRRWQKHHMGHAVRGELIRRVRCLGAVGRSARRPERSLRGSRVATGCRAFVDRPNRSISTLGCGGLRATPKWDPFHRRQRGVVDSGSCVHPLTSELISFLQQNASRPPAASSSVTTSTVPVRHHHGDEPVASNDARRYPRQRLGNEKTWTTARNPTQPFSAKIREGMRFKTLKTTRKLV
jgi:hypothetical protein